MMQLLQFATFHNTPRSHTPRCQEAQLHTLSDEELSGLPTNNLVAERHFFIFSGLAETAKFRKKGFNTEDDNDAGSEWAAKARTDKNDTEEAGERECEDSLVEDQGSCRSNEMKGRCESEHERDEVYPATFGDKEKSGLKLDG